VHNEELLDLEMGMPFIGHGVKWLRTYIHIYIHNIMHFIDPKFSKKNEKNTELVHLQLLEIFYLK